MLTAAMAASTGSIYSDREIDKTIEASARSIGLDSLKESQRKALVEFGPG